MRPKQFFSLFNFIRFVSDVVLLPLIIVLAYSLKFKVGWVAQNIFGLEFGEIYHHAQIEPYIVLMGLSTIIFTLTFYFVGLYGERALIFPEVDDSLKVMKGVTIASVEIMALTFVVNFFPESRFVILYIWVSSILVLSVSRLIIHQIQVSFLKKGVGAKKALVIGADSFAQDLVEKLVVFPALGFQYVGSISQRKPTQFHFHLQEKYNHLGGLKQYKKVHKDTPLDVVFYVVPDREDPYFSELLHFCQANGIELKILSDIARLQGGSMLLEEVDGLPFIVSSQTHQEWRLERGLKRVLDIVFSLVMLILLAPLLVLVGVSIKLVSPKGPVLFSQERVGENGTIFKMLKFRTMIPNAESKTGPVMVNEGAETRYHALGECLRKTSIDELPQFWNILNGEMSVVGPRPERPFFVEKFKEEIPHFDLRHRVKGGLTGWAQVNGRSVLTNRPEHKIKYDLYYINNWSLSLDIKIFLKTFAVVFKQEEAY